MNDDVTPKNIWDQSVNYIKNLKIIVTKLVGLDLKTLLYPALLIYWAIIVEHLGQRSVKLFPGSMIKELDACGLALDPLCLSLDACCLWLSELGA
jgi:hypothetical protein